jgi:L-alanine-DL-glutamate epimerase-like enolase superfamily enzyme
VLRRARQAGLAYCPHFLGAGIGLLASAHLLAAEGGGGLLEVDANPNPLRSELSGVLSHPVDGRCRLGEKPGLGIEPDLARLGELSAGGG